MTAQAENVQTEDVHTESAQTDILYFTRLAADYAQRADACRTPVLALGLRQLAAGYLSLAKRLDAEHDAPRRDAA